MADERASMLERLSEGDRDKVEAAVSRHGDPCERIAWPRISKPELNEGSNLSTGSSPHPKMRTRRCGTRTRRASPMMKGGPSQK